MITVTRNLLATTRTYNPRMVRNIIQYQQSCLIVLILCTSLYWSDKTISRINTTTNHRGVHPCFRTQKLWTWELVNGTILLYNVIRNKYKANNKEKKIIRYCRLLFHCIIIILLHILLFIPIWIYTTKTSSSIFNSTTGHRPSRFRFWFHKCRYAVLILHHRAMDRIPEHKYYRIYIYIYIYIWQFLVCCVAWEVRLQNHDIGR